jgi:hypothetical protein
MLRHVRLTYIPFLECSYWVHLRVVGAVTSNDGNWHSVPVSTSIIGYVQEVALSHIAQSWIISDIRISTETSLSPWTGISSHLDKPREWVLSDARKSISKLWRLQCWIRMRRALPLLLQSSGRGAGAMAAACAARLLPAPASAPSTSSCMTS